MDAYKLMLTLVREAVSALFPPPVVYRITEDPDELGYYAERV